jgi:hypothetical protein
MSPSGNQQTTGGIPTTVAGNRPVNLGEALNVAIQIASGPVFIAEKSCKAGTSFF